MTDLYNRETAPCAK